MEQINRKAAENLEKIRLEKPLIHNITNYVVMNFTANVLLSAGASPVMAHAENEVSEMALLSQALVLNIGTLSDTWVSAMFKAGKTAKDEGKPVILDPVGSGATVYRTDVTKKIISKITPSLIRGNASEILSLTPEKGQTRGVDSIHEVDQTEAAAKNLAEETGSVISVTGKEDLVTDGNRIVRIHNGHPLMGCVTGTGCAATAMTAAFCAVDKDIFSAAATALAFFGLAGEVAAKSASAPGSFMIALIDALYTISPEELENGSRFLIP